MSITYEEHVRRVVDAAPPLSSEQMAHLRMLLGFGDGAGAAALAPIPPTREPIPEPRVALYRHFDEDGVLLYVGVTNNLDSRTRSHTRHSQWSIFAARSEAEFFDTRAEALAAERRAIKEEQPLFNGVGSTHESRLKAVEYLIKRKRLDLLAVTK